MDAPLLSPNSSRNPFFSARSRPTKYGAISNPPSNSTAIVLEKCNGAFWSSQASHFIVHRVAPSDTLYSIAVQYGVPPNQILRANRLSNAAGLTFRNEIRIPVAGASATASTSALLPHSASVPAGLQPTPTPNASSGTFNNESASDTQNTHISGRGNPRSNNVHPASASNNNCSDVVRTPCASDAPSGDMSLGPAPATSDIFKRVDTTLARTRACLDQPDVSSNYPPPFSSGRGGEVVSFASSSSVAHRDELPSL